MRNFARASVDWLRGLFGEGKGNGSTSSGESMAGKAQRASLLQALALTEASLASAVCHLSCVPHSAEIRRRQTRAAAALNAFGAPLLEVDADGVGGSLAVASGLALSGQRVAAFLEGAELGRLREQLAALCERQTPLVLHALLDQHAEYHALQAAGAFLALAGSAQEALDLTLVARRLSELALAPGVIASDGDRLCDLITPSAELVRAYLGGPDDSIPAATPAQRALFGETRRRVPQWFDATRPVTTGARLSPTERALAARGRAHRSAAHLADLARQAADELTALTGRPLPFVHTHGAEGARWVVVAQGSASATAHAVARRLHAADQLSVGSVGLTWLRPLPTDALRAALANAEVVTVLERSDAAPSDAAPLLCELRSRLALPKVRWLSAGSSGAVSAADVSALFSNMQASEPRARVRVQRARAASSFPKRQAVVQALSSSYPDLDGETSTPTADFELAPGEVQVVGLVGAAGRLGADPLEALARAFEDKATPHLEGVELPASGGLWRGRCALSAEPLPAPAESAPIDLLLVSAAGLLSAGDDPFEGARESGQVVIAADLSKSEAWGGLPARWRARIQALKLAVFIVPPRLEELLAMGTSLLAGEGNTHARVLPAQTAAEPEPRPPGLIRRLGEVRASHDCVSRFYGEVVQPRLAEGAGAADAFVTAGVVPALTSAFVDVGPGQTELPVLDAERCTGCGACWSACPDSAIGVGALEPLALLDAAADAAGAEGAAAGALRRAHKHLAGRISGRLAKGEAFSEQLLRESFAWLVEKMGVAEDARADTEAAFEATLRGLLAAPAVVCEAFFSAPEQQSKGSGQLLHLVIDPRSCQSCMVCVAVCPEDALAPTPKTHELAVASQREWEAHEGRPDMSAAAFARLTETERVGPLAALLLSKHYAQAVVGGGGTEAGSGQRLATRLVCAVAEHHTQTHMASWVSDLERLEGALGDRVRGLVTGSFEGVDPGALEEVLARQNGQRVELADLSRRLGDLGRHPNLEREAALRLARAVQDVAHSRWQLMEGESGLGCARFGLVVAGRVAEWAATYPESPVYAPLTVELTDDGVDLARGCAEGMLAEFTTRVRIRRRAALLCEAPSDLPARLAALEQLTWRDLDAEERAACPPLLLLGDDAALTQRGLGRLSRLLSSDLPVKVVLLDGLGGLDAHTSPALVAMAHRRAFVLSASIAHPDHLARGLKRALSYAGPALIHVHAPSPRAHGFSPTATLERARLAVLSRAHPLLTYDPTAEGSFGSRATLTDNPDARATWAKDADGAAFTFVDWAAGERRFAAEFTDPDGEGGAPIALEDYLALEAPRRRGKVPCVGAGASRRAISAALVHAAEERLRLWTALQEVAGLSSPFVDRVREELRAELEAEAAAKVQAAEAACDARLRAADANLERELATRLRERLTALASRPRSS